jgi:hypothetical protein
MVGKLIDTLFCCNKLSEYDNLIRSGFSGLQEKTNGIRSNKIYFISEGYQIKTNKINLRLPNYLEDIIYNLKGRGS